MVKSGLIVFPDTTRKGAIAEAIATGVTFLAQRIIVVIDTFFWGEMPSGFLAQGIAIHKILHRRLPFDVVPS